MVQLRARRDVRGTQTDTNPFARTGRDQLPPHAEGAEPAAAMETEARPPTPPTPTRPLTYRDAVTGATTAQHNHTTLVEGSPRHDDDDDGDGFRTVEYDHRGRLRHATPATATTAAAATTQAQQAPALWPQ